MLRGYVSSEWDRMKDMERDLAQRELRETPEATSAPITTVPTGSDSVAPIPEQDKKAYARRLLGVAEDATFADIRKAFTRLNQRSDPSNFPNGSEEARKAGDIQRKVEWAYQVLTEDMDATERRFRTLELD